MARLNFVNLDILCSEFYPVLGHIKNTLREEIFAGINFHKFFFGHFAGINFRELGFTEDFTGINFRELSLTKDFVGIYFRESALQRFRGSKFSVCLKKHFFHYLSLMF